MRITSKGQVTIPQDIRESFGLLPNTEVEFVVRGDQVFLVKAEASGTSARAARAVALLRGARREVKLSTDELMAMTRGED